MFSQRLINVLGLAFVAALLVPGCAGEEFTSSEQPVMAAECVKAAASQKLCDSGYGLKPGQAVGWFCEHGVYPPEKPSCFVVAATSEIPAFTWCCVPGTVQ